MLHSLILDLAEPRTPLCGSLLEYILSLISGSTSSFLALYFSSSASTFSPSYDLDRFFSPTVAFSPFSTHRQSGCSCRGRSYEEALPEADEKCRLLDSMALLFFTPAAIVVSPSITPAGLQHARSAALGLLTFFSVPPLPRTSSSCHSDFTPLY